MTDWAEGPHHEYERPPKPLPPLLAEFRSALRDEIEAARRSSSSAAVELLSGRRVGLRGSAFQYVFVIESPLNLPDDSPADLLVPGRRESIDATIVSVEGLSVQLSVPLDLGEFIGRARLQSDLTFLLKTLIARIEDLAETPTPAGDRLLGRAPPVGEASVFEHPTLNLEQRAAVASGLGRNLTFIWGPPGTGKTFTIGALVSELHKAGRSVLLVSHANAAVDQALRHVAKATSDEDLKQGLVLRVGDTKEKEIAEWPDLLVKTHVERRSAELIVERDQLATAQAEAQRDIAEHDRLIAIAEWLPQAADRLSIWRTDVGQLRSIERAMDKVIERLAEVESQLMPLAPLKDNAQEAVAKAARVVEMWAVFPAIVDRVQSTSAALDAAESRTRQAIEVAEQSKLHFVELQSARERLVAIRAELPRREPLFDTTQKVQPVEKPTQKKLLFDEE